MAWRIIAVLACMALLPVAYAEPLRFSYEQWLAHQLAKIRHPGLVVIGDSIGAGGRFYGRLDTINLASNGQTTQQTAATLPSALAYAPRRILIVAGMNDAIFGEPDLAALRRYWREMLRDPRTVPALVTPTRSGIANHRIARINAVISSEAALVHKRPLDAPGIVGSDGAIKPELAFEDGTHPRPAAYAEWRARLYQGLR